MIRKPSANWQRLDGGTAVRTVRTAAIVARGGVRVAQRGRQAAVGLVCYLFAAIWGFVTISSGLTMGGWPSLSSIIGVGALAAFMFWAGRWAFAKARATSG
jgi:hypothetical protein